VTVVAVICGWALATTYRPKVAATTMPRTIIKFLEDYPIPDIRRSSKRSSSSTSNPSKPRTDLNRLERWERFEHDMIDSFYFTINCGKIMPDDFDVLPVPADVRPCASERAVERHAYNFVYKHVMHSLCELDVVDGDFLESSGIPQICGDPDFSFLPVKDNPSKPLLVCEWKTPWAIALDEIMESYRNSDKVQNAINQLYGYMTFNYTRYGVLSNWAHTWFFRRGRPNDDQGGVLQAYGPVSWETRGRSSLLNCYCAIITASYRGGDWLYASPTSSPGPRGYNYLQLKPFTPFPNGSSTECNIVFTRIEARGRRSVILRGKLANHNGLVFKAYDVTKSNDAQREYENEYKAYEILEKLQGSAIPQYYGRGELWGILRIIVMDYVGKEVDDDKWDAKLRSAARDLVRKLNDHGIIHGDIRRENFLLDADGTLRVIDFGFAQERGKTNTLSDDVSDI